MVFLLTLRTELEGFFGIGRCRRPRRSRLAQAGPAEGDSLLYKVLPAGRVFGSPLGALLWVPCLTLGHAR
jgi:hypothetical protein